MSHQPVLLACALAAWVTDPGGLYVDATFGRGGHTQALLSQLSAEGRVLALDRDPEAIQAAQNLLDAEPRLTVRHTDFAQLADAVAAWPSANGAAGIHGVLFDLGVSSPQLDQAERGFSFSQPGPLDMRMDSTQGEDAATWLAHADEADIADVLYQYGEERRSRRIASAIVKHRTHTPLTRTDQLAELVAGCLGKQPGKKHPATRTFQAIRMHVNQELAQIRRALARAVDVLRPGGRLVVISFHSIEDRLVKQTLRAYAKPPPHSGDPHVPVPHFEPTLRLLSKHMPTRTDIADNRRARSAVMRVAEKLALPGGAA